MIPASNILALDLGSKTGWCLGKTKDALEIKTVALSKAKEVAEWGKTGLVRRCDPRILRLYTAIKAVEGPLGCIVFEDVQFASTTYQAHLWASLRAAMWLAAAARPEPILFIGVAVGTLKKYATGSGAADKGAMMQAAVREGLNCENLDDNAVDAYHLWCYGYEHWND